MPVVSAGRTKQDKTALPMLRERRLGFQRLIDDLQRRRQRTSYPRSISAKASRALRAWPKSRICRSASTVSSGMPSASSIRFTGT